MEAVVIAREDPRQPEVQRLIRELDAMFEALYPAESNHLLDIETLAADRTSGSSCVRAEGRGDGLRRALAAARHYGEVKRIYVRPEARGRKIGQVILRRLEEEARACSALPLLRLETGIHQPEALGLFAAAGFVPCGCIRRLSGG